MVVWTQALKTKTSDLTTMFGIMLSFLEWPNRYVNKIIHTTYKGDIHKWRQKSLTFQNLPSLFLLWEVINSSLIFNSPLPTPNQNNSDVIYGQPRCAKNYYYAFRVSHKKTRFFVEKKVKGFVQFLKQKIGKFQTLLSKSAFI